MLWFFSPPTNPVFILKRMGVFPTIFLWRPKPQRQARHQELGSLVVSSGVIIKEMGGASWPWILEVSENSGFFRPNHPWINRVWFFHYFHHPFYFEVPLIFGSTHLLDWIHHDLSETPNFLDSTLGFGDFSSGGNMFFLGKKNKLEKMRLADQIGSSFKEFVVDVFCPPPLFSFNNGKRTMLKVVISSHIYIDTYIYIYNHIYIYIYMYIYHLTINISPDHQLYPHQHLHDDWTLFLVGS